jgi:hypothetical protein
MVTAAVAGLECAWVFTLLRTASLGLHLGVFVPSLFLIYAASFACTLGLRATARSSRTTTVISWTVWPLATLALLVAVLQGFSGISHAVKATVFMVLSAGVLWWLGGRLASDRVTYRTVAVKFQFGLIMLACSLLAGYLAGIDQVAAVPVAVVFVGLGLVTAAITRADEKDVVQSRRRGGTWWGMLLIGLTLVLMLGLVAGILFTPELMHLVSRGIRGLWGLIEQLFGALRRILPSSCSEDSDAGVTPATETTLARDGAQGSLFKLPGGFSRFIKILWIILVAGIVLVAAWSVASQLFERMRRKGEDEAQMESLQGAFRLDLARLFRRMLAWVSNLLPFGRLRRKRHEEPTQTTSVRRLYADMLRWGAESGFPRKSAQTPFEYQQTLCAHLPGYRADVAFITETFVRAKYGAQPPTDAELHQVRESRRRLKRRAARAIAGRPASRPTDKTEGHGDTHSQAF